MNYCNSHFNKGLFFCKSTAQVIFKRSADKWILSNSQRPFESVLLRWKYDVTAFTCEEICNTPQTAWQKHSLGMFVVVVFMEERL